MTIRPFEESDRAGVIALWTEVFPAPAPHNDPPRVIDQKLALQRELFFVAETSGAVVGSISFSVQQGVQRADGLDVTPLLSPVATDDDLVCNQETVFLAWFAFSRNHSSRTASSGLAERGV